MFSSVTGLNRKLFNFMPVFVSFLDHESSCPGHNWSNPVTEDTEETEQQELFNFQVATRYNCPTAIFVMGLQHLDPRGTNTAGPILGMASVMEEAPDWSGGRRPMERVKELKEDMKPIKKVHPIMTKTVYKITRIGGMEMGDLDKPPQPPFFLRRSAGVVPALSTYLVFGILNAAVSEKENEGGEKIKSIPFQFQNQVKTVSERENKVVGKMKNIPFPFQFQNQLKTVTWRRPKIVTWTLRKQQEILQFLQRKAVPEANRPALESDT